MITLRAHSRKLVWVLLVCLLASACGGATATATPTVVPTVSVATAFPTVIGDAPTNAATQAAVTLAAATQTTAASATSAATATTAATATAAATSAPTTSPGPQALTVLDYAGYDQAVFWKDFAAKHPSVAPTYSFFADDAEAFSKVASGFAFDLGHPCVSWLKLWVDQGLIQPIDTSRLSNWSGRRPDLAALG